MALKTKKNSLAEKINSLITTTPANFGSDDEAEDTKAKVVDYYDETDDSDDNLQYSKIRRQNVDTLDQMDERYTGRKVSRKDIYENESVDLSDNSKNDSEDNEEVEEMESVDGESNAEMSSDNEVNDNDGSIDENNDSSDGDEVDSEEHSENSEDESDKDDSYDIDIGNPLYRDRRNPQFKTMSDVNVRADIDKGNCVRSQLKLWESLLEIRIKLQKCLLTGNQMPQYDTHKDYKTDSEFMKATNDTKSKLTVLLNNMLQLQQSLLKQYPETKNLGTENRKRKMDTSNEENADSMDEEIPSNTEDEVEDASDSEETKVKETVPTKKLKMVDYEKLLSENHKSYIEYRNAVIQKWNDKTRISTGKANKGMSQTTVKQIEFALSDRQKLQKKTQLKRSEYEIVGKTTKDNDEGRRTQEYDPEIYDDDDFYHQLLRDLIEYKSSDVTDPIQLSKQWIQLQNMRNKMKRKIDTRATKGRRIRYNVHNKLVNFMAPIFVNDTWTDLAKNELYNSLFGKFKSAQGAVSQ